VTTFGPLFVPERLLDAVSDRAWLEAMLEVESALARAEAAAGIVPTEAATAIAHSCRAELYDIEALAREGRSVGNPAEPLVRALRERVGSDVARYVHWGARARRDDTASMLARGAPDLIVVGPIASRQTAGLAETHRSTPMAARTPPAGGPDDVRLRRRLARRVQEKRAAAAFEASGSPPASAAEHSRHSTNAGRTCPTGLQRSTGRAGAAVHTN
jgi:hypothetical protein